MLNVRDSDNEGDNVSGPLLGMNPVETKAPRNTNNLSRHNHEVLSADFNIQSKLDHFEVGKDTCNSLRGYQDYLASSSDMVRHQKDESREKSPETMRKRVQQLRRHQVRKEYSIEDNEIK